MRRGLPDEACRRFHPLETLVSPTGHRRADQPRKSPTAVWDELVTRKGSKTVGIALWITRRLAIRDAADAKVGQREKVVLTRQSTEWPRAGCPYAGSHD